MNENYLYQLTVVTGLRSKSETTSNINFVIAGEREDTGVRTLSDGRKVHYFSSPESSTHGNLNDSTFPFAHGFYPHFVLDYASLHKFFRVSSALKCGSEICYSSTMHAAPHPRQHRPLPDDRALLPGQARIPEDLARQLGRKDSWQLVPGSGGAQGSADWRAVSISLTTYQTQYHKITQLESDYL